MSPVPSPKRVKRIHPFVISARPTVTYRREARIPGPDGVAWNRPSMMLVLAPEMPELLEGLFHLEGGLNWTV